MRQRLSFLCVGIMLLILLSACASMSPGNFASLESDEDEEQPEMIYLIVDSYADDVSEDGDGCEVLPLTKQSTTDPHGKHHYAFRGSQLAPVTDEIPCDELDKRDNPPLVVNLIPAEYRELAGL